MSIPFGRVGYWWSEKKSRKFNAIEFSDVCRAYGLELVKIDLECSLEEQGPFIAIVHKLSDFIVKAESGDQQSIAICEAFQNYANNHPNVVVLDSLQSIKKLAFRNQLYNLVPNKLNLRGDIFIPPFVQLTTTSVSENLAKMKAAEVDFPIVCKPTLAHGSTLAHQMSIIFNEEGLKDIIPPCIAQKFINHNAVLYKLFTIGEKYFIIERPSLKNFTAGDQKTIYFNSHDVSKPNSASKLNELDDSEPLTPSSWPDKEKMDWIVKVLCKTFGSLLGIDVIIDKKTGHYGVIDINIFPGYDGIDDFFQLLCELIVQKVSNKAAGIEETDFQPVLMDYKMSPRGHQKFSFDTINPADSGQSKAIIPYSPRCLCCPISSICLNTTHTEIKHSKSVLSYIKSPQFHSHDYTQDDSGIETSDSCDEKKESCTRTLRRLHLRTTLNSSTIAFNES